MAFPSSQWSGFPGFPLKQGRPRARVSGEAAVQAAGGTADQGLSHLIEQAAGSGRLGLFLSVEQRPASRASRGLTTMLSRLTSASSS